MRAGEGRGEAFGRDGLEEIIERIHFESFEGILVIGSGEDHQWDAVELFEELEAGAAGHLDIEEEQVGLESGDLSEGVFRVAGFAGDFDFGMRFEEAAQFGAAEAFVIDDEGLHAGLSGIEISATTESLS